MKLFDCLSEQTVHVGAAPADRESVLAALVDLVLAPAAFMDRQALLDELLAREKLGSTGIGEGVAVPHVHLDGVEDLHVALMTVPGGVDYDAIDDLPCKSFIIVVAPDEDREGYLRLLSAVSRIFHKADVREAVLAAKSAADLLKVIKDAEA